MYFVDREKIEQTLQLIENNVSIFKQQETWDGALEKLAFERIVHLLIESILDVGNSLIDGFIMRDPGSYEDIIDILLDEKVISAEDETPFKAIIAYRKPIVQDYLEINHANVFKGLTENLQAVEKFPNDVRRYLGNELDTITAFKR